MDVATLKRKSYQSSQDIITSWSEKSESFFRIHCIIYLDNNMFHIQISCLWNFGVLHWKRCFCGNLLNKWILHKTEFLKVSLLCFFTSWAGYAIYPSHIGGGMCTYSYFKHFLPACYKSDQKYWRTNFLEPKSENV